MFRNFVVFVCTLNNILLCGHENINYKSSPWSSLSHFTNDSEREQMNIFTNVSECIIYALYIANVTSRDKINCVVSSLGLSPIYN